MPIREQLSRGQARRVALAAQGFGRPALDRPVGMRDVQATIARLGQFQIDSVNVVTRAHRVPLFSRLGPYDVGLLERAAHRPPRRLFEYWGHAASLIDVALEPLLRFRMAAGPQWGAIIAIGVERPDLVAWVRDQVDQLGPVSARDLGVIEERDRSHWGWNWSAVKTALEYLFWHGEVSTAYRNSQFERVYDVSERVLPAAVVAQPTPPEADAVRGLVQQAARALGVATEPALRDYFRTRPEVTRTAVAELVEAGELLPVTVAGETRPCYLWHEARVPRSLHARALCCPFDSVVFERDRLESLFDFRYRIEIYVPEPQRVHGYYVYPFLLGDRFVARVDLKADRATGALLVRAAWAETGVEPAVQPGEVAAELAAELASMAEWLGLSQLVVYPAGDLAAALAVAVDRSA